MSLKISLDQIPPEGLQLVGETDSAFLELGNGDYRASRPVGYDLRLTNLDSLLHVQGEIWAPLDATCGRCLGEFPLTLSLDDHHLALDIESGTDEVDLGAALREDLMLDLPAFPRCEDGDDLEDGSERTCAKAGTFERRESPSITEDGTLQGESTELDPEAAKDRWKALDGLENLGNVLDPSPEDDSNPS